MFCQKCGTENSDTRHFCGNCNAPLRLVQNVSEKEKMISTYPLMSEKEKMDRKLKAEKENKVQVESDKEKRIHELNLQITEQKKIIDETEGNGWVIILGTFGVLTLFIGIGIIILIIAIAWGWDRHSKNTRAREELRHLETLKEMHK